MMNNLNVLLVSYVFPPLGGTGVMRAASLARYLPHEGIRLDVLTARNAAAVGRDPSLLNDIPDSVTIHRTVTLDLPFGIKKKIKKLITRDRRQRRTPSTGNRAHSSGALENFVANILQPDPQVTWYPVLVRAAQRLVRERRIDVVLVTVPPFSNLLLVPKLREQFPDLPIVVDFRDEWITTTFDLVSFLFSSGDRARGIAHRIEARAVEDATAVVAVTEAARRQIRARYPGQPEGKFLRIPNGFEPACLPCLAPPPRPSDRIVVSYVGTVYASTAPTGLVDALLGLPIDIRSRFLLRFIGHIEEPRFRRSLLQLGDMVELKGFMPQREALALMNETDYALLLNHDPLNVGGKLYDYAGSGKPILGAVHPHGETRRLIEEFRAGWWADAGDVNSMRTLFLDAAARGKAPFPDFRPDRARIAQYEREALAKRYAALLHSIAAGAHDDESLRNLAKRTGTGS